LADMDTQGAEATGFAPPPGPAAGGAQQRDLYALGASFYFLATGARPTAPNPASAKRLNPGVSRDLSDILAHCLNAAPEGCYTTADALVGDLERVLGTETVLAPPGRRLLLLAESIGVWHVGLMLSVATFVAFQIVGFRYTPGGSHDGTLLYLAAPTSLMLL